MEYEKNVDIQKYMYDKHNMLELFLYLYMVQAYRLCCATFTTGNADSAECALRYWHDKLSPFENTIKIYEYVVMKKVYRF